MTKLTDGLLTLAEFAKAVNATYNQVYLWVTKHGLFKISKVTLLAFFLPVV